MKHETEVTKGLTTQKCSKTAKVTQTTVALGWSVPFYAIPLKWQLSNRCTVICRHEILYQVFTLSLPYIYLGVFKYLSQ